MLVFKLVHKGTTKNDIATMQWHKARPANATRSISIAQSLSGFYTIIVMDFLRYIYRTKSQSGLCPILLPRIYFYFLLGVNGSHLHI